MTNMKNGAHGQTIKDRNVVWAHDVKAGAVGVGGRWGSTNVFEQSCGAVLDENFFIFAIEQLEEFGLAVRMGHPPTSMAQLKLAASRQQNGPGAGRVLGQSADDAGDENGNDQ